MLGALDVLVPFAGVVVFLIAFAVGYNRAHNSPRAIARWRNARHPLSRGWKK